MTYTPPALSLEHWGAELRSKWGWFIALGVALLFMGAFAFANLFTATVASVYLLGIVMIVAGFAQIINAFQVRRWGGFLFWFLSGLLYGAAGFFALYNPVLAASTLTLFLAVMLIASGVMRIWSSLQALRMRLTSNWSGWPLSGRRKPSSTTRLIWPSMRS